MKSSLIPEKPILVYPGLAATLGLEESVLLSVLTDLASQAQTAQSNGFEWATISADRLRAAVPFWQDQDLVRVCNSLHGKGVLLVGSARFGEHGEFRFAFNERLASQHHTGHAQTRGQSQVQPRPQPGLQHIGPQWQPDHHTLAQLAQHNIPESFARQQVPEFITYWRERGEAQRSWGAKFLQHVIRQWRQYEAQLHRQQKANEMLASWRPSDETIETLETNLGIKREFLEDIIAEFVVFWRERGEAAENWDSKFIAHATREWRRFCERQNQQDQGSLMHDNWRPSPDAMEMLTVHSGVRSEFCEDAIPEFVFYWKDVGDAHKNWNAKFVQHVRLQWKKFQSALEHSTDPKPIPVDWQPSEDVYDVLRLANIDLRFAHGLIPEFVIYWRDSNQLHTSWNTRFLQHAKREWARQHGQANASNGTPQQRSTRDISLEEELSDRSWAY
ncbi:DnaT-like ssDNA-binding domain-containing protein [Teredinibacter turnerae]|uniref:DnaT-like ssDNA-binding domain-containing protein n=1 Tax=Teredinibacter turnerae TaxID=2426 RepID=UPI00036252F7|nr:DnaT-like ssDNA-binding domain-containing protein [Teredinibacter turnerae]